MRSTPGRRGGRAPRRARRRALPRAGAWSTTVCAREIERARAARAAAQRAGAAGDRRGAARACRTSRTWRSSTRRSTRRSRDEAATYAVPAALARGLGHAPLRLPRAVGAWSVERAGGGARRPRLRLVVCHLGGGSSVTAVARRPLGRHDDGLQPARGRADDDALGLGRSRRARATCCASAAWTPSARPRAEHESGMTALAGGDGRSSSWSGGAAGDEEPARARRLRLSRRGRRRGDGGRGPAASTRSSSPPASASARPRVRERVCDRLGFLGVELDPARNAGGRARLRRSPPRAPCGSHVVARARGARRRPRGARAHAPPRMTRGAALRATSAAAATTASGREACPATTSSTASIRASPDVTA